MSIFGSLFQGMEFIFCIAMSILQQARIDLLRLDMEGMLKAGLLIFKNFRQFNFFHISYSKNVAFPWYFKGDLEFIHSTFYSMCFYPTIFRFSVLPTRHSRAIRKRSRSAVSRRLQSATQSQENEKVSGKIIHRNFTFSSFTKLDYF